MLYLLPPLYWKQEGGVYYGFNIIFFAYRHFLSSNSFSCCPRILSLHCCQLFTHTLKGCFLIYFPFFVHYVLFIPQSTFLRILPVYQVQQLYMQVHIFTKKGYQFSFPILYFFGTFLDFSELPCYTITRCKTRKNQGLTRVSPISGVK